ncbi:hypothetical protein ACWCXC_15585 [Streptomyces sp. NPDC001515]
MAGLDALLGASVEAVRRSGALESGAIMAVVSAVRVDGTVDCARADDLYPSVRILSGYQAPAVGDRVELLRTVGGWVCLGALQSATPAPQWITAALAGGYTTDGNANGVVQYRRYVDRGTPYVEWSGGLSWTTSGTPPNGGVFFTVPAAFRPTSLRSVAAAAGGVCTKVDFTAAGACTVIIPSGSALTTWCSLNNVRYRID